MHQWAQSRGSNERWVRTKISSLSPRRLKGVGAVISKTALRTLCGRSGVTPSEVVKIYHAELSAIIERKVAGGEHSDPIRLHGTDLN